jgi:hypothetical protein
MLIKFQQKPRQLRDIEDLGRKVLAGLRVAGGPR